MGVTVPLCEIVEGSPAWTPRQHPLLAAVAHCMSCRMAGLRAAWGHQTDVRPRNVALTEWDRECGRPSCGSLPPREELKVRGGFLGYLALLCCPQDMEAGYTHYFLFPTDVDPAPDHTRARLLCESSF